MDRNNPTNDSRQENNFFGGFLLGVLVGAAVVFLLGTEKGKRLLKAISEDGIDNFANILDEKEVVRKEKVAEVKSIKLNKDRSFAESPRPKVRRFFRGISRHVN